MRLEHIERRIEQQLTIRDQLENSYENLIRVGYPNLSSQRIQVRLASLTETWEQFSLIHNAITLSTTKLSTADRARLQQNSYFTEHVFTCTHECYLDTLERITSLSEPDTHVMSRPLSNNSDYQITNSPAVHSQPRLPKHDVPKFNGSESEWLNFKDMFRSLILNNPTLSSVEKLQYLKSSLIGSASYLLKNTVLTADNFQKSWDAVLEFYENKRILVSDALQSLFSLRRMRTDSASELELLYNSISEIYRTFETLQRPINTWDDILVFITVQRLDPNSVKTWEHHLGNSKEPPTWKQLREFLLTELRSRKAFEKSQPSKISKSSQIVARTHYQGKSAEVKPYKNVSCSICSANHFITKCPQYLAKPIQQRVAMVKKHQLCFNCLAPHRVSGCRITQRCRKCGKKHHTTIHQINGDNTPQVITKPAGSSTTTHILQAQSLHTSQQSVIPMSSVILATAQVIILGQKGESILTRALIDQGSEISLISEHLAQLLRLPRTSSSIRIVGIGGKTSTKVKGTISFKMTSHFDSAKEYIVSAHILSKLTSHIPAAKMELRNWPHLQGLQLADPTFTEPNKIDIILGADVHTRIIRHRLVKGGDDVSIAQNTELGWIISGPSERSETTDQRRSYHISLNRELHDLIHKFWESEEVSTSSTSCRSVSDQECEDYFVSTHSRDHQGRYVVRLPFKQSAESLGNSRVKAERMLMTLSKRLQEQTDYSHAYTQFMNEYEILDHMRRVPDDEPEPSISYYLPHHGVVRTSSLTTKLRVVFNGSSRSTTGLSLNDLLHTGEKLQNDIFNVLLWFRQFRYVFSTDVEKMYRQIKIHPSDWNFQRILWLDQSLHVNTYQLTTVTYGLACAPYLALRTLSQLIHDEGKNHPLAVPVLEQGRYVDDLFGGSDTIDQTCEIIQQLNELCMAGGFPLQKWTSNNLEVLNSISKENQGRSTLIPLEENTSIHVLGLCWKPSADTFQFIFDSPSSTVVTKRSTLSTIAKLFDPLGLISPVIITAKIFIQELWSLKLEWDDPLPSHLTAKWVRFLGQLQDASRLLFPRWLGTLSNHEIVIHGFCDASQHAMSAVVYIRTTNDKGEGISTILCSKTKVAPLKRVTIPRLELLGAALLTKLMAHTIKILAFSNTVIFMWTDSAVTYTWINSHPSKWKEYVHNRVCYIQETLPQATWRFVPGNENPADCATRGLSPAQLSTHSIWWTGPAWLSQGQATWPQLRPRSSYQDNLEERITRTFVVTKQLVEDKLELLNRYSNFNRLLRITAWCLRAICRFKGSSSPSITEPITTHELESAKRYLIKTVQQESFYQELSVISKGQSLSKSNPLLRLTPYIDSDGLLRIGGRLQSSMIPSSAKHPVILPKNSKLSSLIIADAHNRTLHGGTQLTLAFIREDYWIIGGRNPVRSFILKCVRCARFRQQKAQQLMGQLPKDRVTPSRPFLNTGVDYAGPFQIKTWKDKNARSYKAFISLFVCLSTSALHLELVTDYTTEAFLAAYKRFTSRRGICATLRSDCGTNFKGAEKELRQLFLSSKAELNHLATLLANDGTQ